MLLFHSCAYLICAQPKFFGGDFSFFMAKNKSASTGAGVALDLTPGIDFGKIYSKLYSAISKPNKIAVYSILNGLPKPGDLIYVCSTDEMQPTLVEYCNQHLSSALQKWQSCKADFGSQESLRVRTRYNDLAELGCILANAAVLGKYPREVPH